MSQERMGPAYAGKIVEHMILILHPSHSTRTVRNTNHALRVDHQQQHLSDSVFAISLVLNPLPSSCETLL